MVRMLMRTAVALATVGIVEALPCFSRGGEPPVVLSKDGDSVFRLEAFSSTGYFHFGKNGKYRQIAREHMFIAEMDRGRWRQDARGEIELRSAVLAKDVKCGPLAIAVGNVERQEALGTLEKDMGEFLAADTKDSYAPDEIEDAWKYTYTWSLFGSTRTFKAVEVDDGLDKVTREQLVGLLDAWRGYLKDDTRSCFHFVPVKHHKFVLLASGDYPFLANAETAEEAKKTADTFGASATSETPPSMVYVLVDSAGALAEMKTKQPFIFHPELNEAGGTRLLRYK